MERPRKPCTYIAEKIHIGKSSCGWCFAVHIYPGGLKDIDREYCYDIAVYTLQDWTELWQYGYIKDEYGWVINPEYMAKIITERSMRNRQMDPDWYTRNHAVAGPNGLARHQIDGVRCVGHGEGTYDYLVRDFS